VTGEGRTAGSCRRGERQRERFPACRRWLGSTEEICPRAAPPTIDEAPVDIGVLIKKRPTCTIESPGPWEDEADRGFPTPPRQTHWKRARFESATVNARDSTFLGPRRPKTIGLWSATQSTCGGANWGKTSRGIAGSGWKGPQRVDQRFGRHYNNPPFSW